VQEEELPLAVNDCSLQSKLRQQRGRRRNMAAWIKLPHEKPAMDGTLESFCGYRSPEDFLYVHPDSLPILLRQHPDHTFIHLVREAPLFLKGPGRWLVFEELGARDG
jgi:hypothetical protein